MLIRYRGRLQVSKLQLCVTDNLGRGDDLPDVALRVVGNVDEQAAEGRWQPLSPHHPGLLQVGRVEGVKPIPTALDHLIEPPQQEVF